jgi:hypothetical protein
LAGTWIGREAAMTSSFGWTLVKKYMQVFVKLQIKKKSMQQR